MRVTGLRVRECPESRMPPNVSLISAKVASSWGTLTEGVRPGCRRARHSEQCFLSQRASGLIHLFIFYYMVLGSGGWETMLGHEG